MKMALKVMWAVLAGLILASAAQIAGAQANKPRVKQVNQRLKNQHNRVKAGVKNGSLNKQQAHQINRQDARINQEKKNMMAQDGGHLTKTDQAKLNHQENHVSNEINRDEAQNTGH